MKIAKKTLGFLTLIFSIIGLCISCVSERVYAYSHPSPPYQAKVTLRTNNFQDLADDPSNYFRDGSYNFVVEQWGVSPSTELFCADTRSDAPTVTPVTYTSPVPDDRMPLKKILYYGAGGPDCRLNAVSKKWAYTAIMCSIFYSGVGLKEHRPDLASVDADIRSWYNNIQALPAPPENYHVWRITCEEVKTSGGWGNGRVYQTVVFGDYGDEGNGGGGGGDSTPDPNPDPDPGPSYENPDLDRVTVTVDGTASGSKDWNFDKLDKLTHDKLSGGSFKIEISNISGYRDGSPNAGVNTYDEVMTQRAENGKVSGSFSFKSPNLTGTGSERYIRNYNAISPENQNKYKNYAKSASEARRLAEAEAEEDLENSKRQFRNAPRNVRITETKAPDSYTLEKTDQITNPTISQGTGTIYNYGSEEVTVYKVDNQGNRIPGASFTMHREIDNKKVHEWISSQQGNLKDGLTANTKYIVEETRVPEGYVTPIKTKYEITTGNAGSTNELTITNAKVTFTKKDATGAEEVEGAKMVVKDKETGQVVDTWYSTKQPHNIKNLVEGKEYTLTEEIAPGGYNISNTITFTPTTEDINLEMKDTIERAVKKKPNGEYIEGAGMQALVKAENADKIDLNDPNTYVVKDEWTTRDVLVNGYTGGNSVQINALAQGVTRYNNGRTVRSATIEAGLEPDEVTLKVGYTDGSYDYYDMDKQGKETYHRIRNLKAGEEYVLNENVVPTGYTKANPITTNTNTEKDTTTSMLDTQITFTKKDAGGEEVIGAHMTVYDENDNKVDQWISNGTEHKIKNLIQGNKYRIHEEITPNGYVWAHDIWFTVSDQEDQNFEMIDTIQNVKKVDDENNFVYGATMQVIEKESGKIIDEWVTGANLIELTEDQQEVLAKGQELTFTVDGTEYKFMPKVVENTDDQEVELYNKPSFTLRTRKDDLYRYYEVDAKGNELGHRISNAKADTVYIIKEAITPDGYVKANDKEITMPSKEDNTLVVVDTEYRTKKYDEHENYVTGASMQVIDKETGKVVDQWKSNENIIRLTKDQTNRLENGETLTVDKDGFRYTFTPKEEGMTEEPIKQPEVEEENESDTSDLDSSTNDLDADTSTEDKDEGITMKKKYSQFSLVVYEIPTEEITEIDDTNEMENTDQPEIKEAGTLNITGTKRIPNNFAYYEVDSRGTELEHRIRNIEANKEYILREEKAPEGYVKAMDEIIIAPAEKDAFIVIIDKQVQFTKEDINGEEVEGAKITIVDEEGNKVDQWISKKEPHYINNLEVGKKYTLIEEITPNGYVQANALEFTMTKEGIDTHYKMVDTIHRIIKVDDTGLPVKDARLAVYDQDGKKVDEWITGQHIIDIPERCLEEIETEGISRIEPDEIVPEITEETITEVKGEMDNALRFLYPDLDKIEGIDTDNNDPETDANEPVTLEDVNVDDVVNDLEHPEVVPGQVDENGNPIEEVTLTKEDYLKAGFEKLALTNEELNNKVVIASQMLDKATDEQHAEDVRTDLYELVDETVEEVNTKIEEQNRSVVGVYVYKNEQSAGGYTVRYVEKDGTMRYVDIDEHGDEANHRVSGLKVGETYILKELKAPFGFNLAPEMEFIAEGSTDIKMTMIDTPLLLQSSQNTSASGGNIIVYVGGCALMVLIACATLMMNKKRNKVNR